MEAVLTKLGKSLLLLSMCASLLACESKEEKRVRIEKEAIAAEKSEVDKLFAGGNRVPVDLSQRALDQVRPAAPQPSIRFEDETADMTEAGEGAASACSPTLGAPEYRENCIGKVVIARGIVDAFDGEHLHLNIEGVALSVSVPAGSTAPELNDYVQVRGSAAVVQGADRILLTDTLVEKQPRVISPGEARMLDAVNLGNICRTGKVELDGAPAHIADVAMDPNDREGGIVTGSDGGRKINDEWIPYIKRCAISAGKVIGEQVRQGKISDGKAILTEAAGEWESNEVLTAQLDKADAVRRAADREASKARGASDSVGRESAASGYNDTLEARKRKSAQAACVGLTSNYNDAKECMRNMGY